MGFFDVFKRPDIDQGVEDQKAVPGSVLLDVRTQQEYSEGHIPDSINLPLQSMDRIDQVISEKDTPLFVYCYSGARSSQAVSIIRSKGYTNVTNIGGIANYSGKVER